MQSLRTDGGVIHENMNEATGAMRLLQDFGSRRVMVRNILLDVDMACSIPCNKHGVGPLLIPESKKYGPEHAVEMWSLAAAAANLPHLKVEFVHPKRRIHYNFHPLNGALEHDIGVRLDMLNIVFQTLGKDAIGIRKYGKQIGEVFIRRDCTEGTVVFRLWRSIPIVDLVKLHFGISDEGKTFTWTSLERKPRRLLALPYHIRKQILNEVSFAGRTGPCNDDPEIVWDLNQRTLTGASLISGEICRELRFEFRPMLQCKQNHVLRMGTRELRADFGTFQNLQRLWSTHVSYDAPMGTYEAPVPANFLLEFHVPPETTLEDISLNITPLLRLTQAYRGRTKITI